jgi:hypothetical protein
LVVIIIVAGAVWFVVERDGYPCSASKGVGYGPAIDAPSTSRAGTTVGAGPADSPERALASLAASDAPRMGAERIPATGWVEKRGRWVRDMSPSTFYEATLTHGSDRWEVSSYRLCSR